MLLFLTVLTEGKHATTYSYAGLTSSHSLSHLEELDSSQAAVAPSSPSFFSSLGFFLPTLEISEATCFTPHIQPHIFLGSKTCWHSSWVCFIQLFPSHTCIKAVLISHLSFRCHTRLHVSGLYLLYNLLLSQKAGRCLLHSHGKYFAYLQQNHLGDFCLGHIFCMFLDVIWA